MIEDISKWLAIASVAVGLLWSHFKVIAKVDKNEEDIHREVAALQSRADKAETDLEDLKENKTRNNTLLQSMAKSQEETRLDVKTILQSIATLAANQNRNKDE